jgi:hypothetical protein
MHSPPAVRVSAEHEVSPAGQALSMKEGLAFYHYFAMYPLMGFGEMIAYHQPFVDPNCLGARSHRKMAADRTLASCFFECASTEPGSRLVRTNSRHLY